MPDTRHPTVLIVDDEQLYRRALGRMLDRLDCTTLEAGDGVEALELIESERPDLVLMDIRMPELDGFGVLEALREKKIESFVVMLAADGGPVNRRRAQAGGASAFYRKPISMEQLKSLLRKLR